MVPVRCGSLVGEKGEWHQLVAVSAPVTAGFEIELTLGAGDLVVDIADGMPDGTKHLITSTLEIKRGSFPISRERTKKFSYGPMTWSRIMARMSSTVGGDMAIISAKVIR